MSVKDDKIHKGHDSDQHRYDDLINLPHHVSSVHPHMCRLSWIGKCRLSGREYPNIRK